MAEKSVGILSRTSFNARSHSLRVNAMGDKRVSHGFTPYAGEYLLDFLVDGLPYA